MHNTDDFVLRFGRFAGQTLAEVAEQPAGLRWLDWAVDDLSPGLTRDAIRQYVSRPEIQRAISRMLDEEDD